MAKPNTRSTLKDIRHEEMFQSKRKQPSNLSDKAPEKPKYLFEKSSCHNSGGQNLHLFQSIQ